MSAAATVIDEVKELYNAALRDVGAMVRAQAVDCRRLGIQAAARGNDVDSAYAFGAAAALEAVALAFENR